MDVLIVIAVLVGLVIFDFFAVAYLFRKKKGRFQIRRDDDHAFVFATDFGRFAIDLRKHRLQVGSTGSGKVIALDDIKRLDFGYATEWAGFEEWLTGFDIWDVFSEYRDTNHWYQISVVLAGSEKIPLFLGGQYEPREPLVRWWFEFQARVLQRLGLFENVEEVAQTALALIQGAFERAGRPLRTV